MNRRFEQLLMHTLGLEGEARESFIDSVRDQDEALARRLLRSIGFDTGLPERAAIPERIGSYRIIDKIGEGGMGTVFLARQEEPARDVALKILGEERFAGAFIERFRWEVQLLARLKHPNIATVYEAGLTPHGEPFFSMELIEEGVPITRFCADATAGLEDRIRLFLQVLDGVGHAHENGIVHRDLKPNNVLVTRMGGRAHVKIIDFGVAGETEPGPDQDVALAMGTPAYTSPEQLASPHALADVRGDVYALGVILYEILCGHQPWSTETLAGKSFPEALDELRRHRPDPPSHRLSAGSRHLSRELSRDLDWVVMKAMAADPAQRYAGVAALAEDLRRYLDRRTVNARAPSTMYAISWFAARNRAWLGLISAFLVLLVVLGATAIQARLEALRVEHELQQYAAMIRFPIDMANPRKEKTAALKREELFFFERQLEAYPDDHPLMVDLRHDLGVAWLANGKYARAWNQLNISYSVRVRELGENAPETLATAFAIATCLRRLGEYESAELLFMDTIKRQQAVHGEFGRETLRSQAGLAMVLRRQKRRDEALALFCKVLDDQTAMFGWADQDTALSMVGIANTLVAQRDLEPAMALYEEAHAIQKKELGLLHPELLATLSSYGDCARKLKRYERAEALLTQAFERRREVLGAEHDLTELAGYRLALTWLRQKQTGSAIELLETIHQKHVGSGRQSHTTLLAVNLLAGTYFGEDRREEAITLLRDVVEEGGEEGLRQEVQLRRGMNNLGYYLHETGQYKEAIVVLQRLLAVLANVEDMSDEAFLQMQIVRVTLGQALYCNRQPKKALQMTKLAFDEADAFAPDHQSRHRILGYYGYMLRCCKQPEGNAKLRESVKQLRDRKSGYLGEVTRLTKKPCDCPDAGAGEKKE